MRLCAHFSCKEEARSGVYFLERTFSETRILVPFFGKICDFGGSYPKTGNPANDLRKVRVRRGAPHPTPATGAFAGPAGTAEGRCWRPTFDLEPCIGRFDGGCIYVIWPLQAGPPVMTARYQEPRSGLNELCRGSVRRNRAVISKRLI